MTNPFKQPEALWKAEFAFLFHLLPLLEEYFDGTTLAVSSYELESKTVESMPDDLWCFEAYFDSKPDAHDLNTKLQQILGNCKLKVSRVQNIDWVAQMHENFEPISVGRFFITNPSQMSDCPQGMDVLIMESSRAFGTGEHNTTKGCIEAMDAISSMSLESIMDIGTGTGILTIAAAKIWPKAQIVGSDIESVAVEISAQHALSNNVDIKFFTLAGLPDYDKKVDLIVSNILKTPLIELAPDFASILSEHGVIILSGFLDYQLPEVIEAYNNEGFKDTNILNKEGWITLTLMKDYQ